MYNVGLVPSLEFGDNDRGSQVCSKVTVQQIHQAKTLKGFSWSGCTAMWIVVLMEPLNIWGSECSGRRLEVGKVSEGVTMLDWSTGYGPWNWSSGLSGEKNPKRSSG